MCQGQSFNIWCHLLSIWKTTIFKEFILQRYPTVVDLFLFDSVPNEGKEKFWQSNIPKYKENQCS